MVTTLAIFGMHVLNDVALSCLREVRESPSISSATLSDATSLLPSRGRYPWHTNSADRDTTLARSMVCSSAQLALTLAGDDRDRLMTELLELLMLRPSSMGPTDGS